MGRKAYAAVPGGSNPAPARAVSNFRTPACIRSGNHAGGHMSPTPLHRALVALAVFTFASWGLIAAAIVLWSPGRSLAASAVSRVARAAAGTPSAGSLAAVAMTDLAPCNGPGS